MDPIAWQPMETAPRGRFLRAKVEGEERIVMFTKTSHIPLWGWCLVDQGPEDCDLCQPSCWAPMDGGTQ